MRVVVSRLIDLPLMSQLARTAREVPVWICHGPDAAPETRQAWDGLGARLFPCALSGRQVSARAVLQALGAAGLTRVFCEGGVALGAEGQPSLGAMGLDRLRDAPRFRLAETRAAGADVMHRWLRV